MEETMNKTPEKVVVRPLTLNEGKEYLLRVDKDNGHNPIFLQVKFVGYLPCPALILIRGGAGQLWKVPRDNIFSTESMIWS